MADVTTTWSLDPSGVIEGTRRANAEIRRSADTSGGALERYGQQFTGLGRKVAGGAAVFAVFRYLSDSVKEYAERNVEARAELDKLDQAWKKLKQGTGRDIYELFNGVGDAANKAADAFRSLRGTGVTVEGRIDSLRDIRDNQIRSQAALKESRNQIDAIAAARAAAGGDNRPQVELQATAEYEKQADAIKKLEITEEARAQLLAVAGEKRALALSLVYREYQLSQQSQELQTGLLENETQRAGVAQRRLRGQLEEAAILDNTLSKWRDLATLRAQGLPDEVESAREIAISARYALDLEASLSQIAKQRSDALDSARQAAEASSIEVQMARLKASDGNAQADLLAIQLKLQQELASIAKNDLLTQAQKADFSRQAIDDALQLKKISADSAFKTAQERLDQIQFAAGGRTIGFGLTGSTARLATPAFASPNPNSELAKVTAAVEDAKKAQLEVLQEIADNTAKTTAKFGQ